MQFPFSDSGTKRLNFVIPPFGAHVFRPKGPGSALSRAGFIDRTLLPRKVNAIGTPVFDQVIITVGSNTVLLGELSSGHLEPLSQVLPIFECEIDVAVFATRGTAIARFLTLKADSLAPPWGLLFLTHFLQCSREVGISHSRSRHPVTEAPGSSLTGTKTLPVLDSKGT